MVMQRALIIGGSYSAIPIGKAILENGYALTLITGDPNEPLAAYASELIICDYSDVQKSMEALRGKSFNKVIPSCNDAAFTLGAFLANERKLPGFDSINTVETVNSKILFRKFCSQSNISAPKIHLNPNHIQESDLPIIVKPNMSFSGRGVSIVQNLEFLDSAIAAATANSRDSKFNMESFIDGTLHSISTFVVNKKISSFFFVDEFCVTYPFQVDNSNHPSRLSEKIKTKTIEEVNKICEALELVNGLLHVQFMVQHEEIYVIECMRRCPGDLYGNLIEYSTNFKYYDAYVRGYLGVLAEGNHKPIENLPIGRFTESSKAKRTLTSFRLNGKIREFFPLATAGQKIEAAPFGKSSIGFVQYENTEEMYSHSINHGESMEFISEEFREELSEQ
jgi:biotin carboxylase